MKMEWKIANKSLTNNGSTASVNGMYSPMWISTLVINIFLIAVSIWIMLTVLVYGYKSGKFISKREGDYSGGIIMKLLFAATVLVLPRFAITNVITWIGFDVGPRGDFECEIAMDISFPAYYLGVLPAYFFLWARQRCLYKQPSISVLCNRIIKVVSWGSILILTLSGIGIVILFMLPLAYRSSPNGCVLREEEEDNDVVFYVLPVVLVSGQLLLLGLFIYPLYRHKNIQVLCDKKKEVDKDLTSEQSFSSIGRASFATEDNAAVGSPRIYKKSNQSSRRTSRLSLGMRKISMDRSSQLPRGSTFSLQSSKKKKKSTMKTKSRLIAVIRRSVICAIVCIVSDLIATLAVSVLLPKEMPKSFSNTGFDISLLVNIISLVFSFESYKAIFKTTCRAFSNSTKSSLNTSKSSSVDLNKSK